MPFVSLKEAIAAMPGERPCAIGAFNFHNIEYAKAIAAAAEEEKTPVILMISELMAQYMGLDIMAAVGKIIAQKATVPIAVMLDHGKELSLIDEAIERGLSVMYDGSDLPFEENAAMTRRIVEKAHRAGGSVEGEVGCLGQSEEGGEHYAQKLTTPAQAAAFIAKTGVDVLAIAVGNAHGFYQGEQNIDIERIADIKQAVRETPIVMHGGSGMEVKIVRAAINAGIAKFNIATDLKYAYAEAMRAVLREELPLAPPVIFGAVQERIKQVTAEKIRLFLQKS